MNNITVIAINKSKLLLLFALEEQNTIIKRVLLSSHKLAELHPKVNGKDKKIEFRVTQSKNTCQNSVFTDPQSQVRENSSYQTIILHLKIDKFKP